MTEFLFPDRPGRLNRKARVATAWNILVDRDQDDATLRRACETLIADCTDARRDTARDILALLEPTT